MSKKKVVQNCLDLWYLCVVLYSSTVNKGFIDQLVTANLILLFVDHIGKIWTLSGKGGKPI